MPTASKLIAAVFFAALGWVAADLYAPNMPDGASVGRLREIAAVLGVVFGWRTSGALAGRGWSEAVSNGLVTSFLVLVSTLFVCSFYQMIMYSMDMRYDGPMSALLGVFDIILGYAKLLAYPATPVVLAVGGVLGGFLSESAARRWS